MGVPAFSCSVVAVITTAVTGEFVCCSTGQEEVEELEVDCGAIIVAGGANDLKNSSTCSKQPRSISCEKERKRKRNDK